jgi:isopenicillin N synthase-like dioxygenase
MLCDPPNSVTDAHQRYHDAVAQLAYTFVHLIEEAFAIPVGTFDHLFTSPTFSTSPPSTTSTALPPQHRIKLLHYPPVPASSASNQGVGPHKDSSGWLTFLYQPPHPEGGLAVLSPQTGEWIPAPPIEGTFVVNIGNAFEAATEGAVRATVHKVDAPQSRARYSVPFFMGLPLDLTVSEVRSLMPEGVRREGRERARKAKEEGVSAFLDPRWDSLGESQLRKWIRSHEDVGRRWYGDEVCAYYLS